MEPSSTDEITVELFRLLHAARREESCVSLNTLAKLIAENLKDAEPFLLADMLIEHARNKDAALEQKAPPFSQGSWRAWRLLRKGRSALA